MKVIQKWLTENSEQPDPVKSKRDAVKCIIKNDDKVLILRRATTTLGSGEWDLPGGGIEKGEEAEEAVKREVKEETRLRLTKPVKITTITLVHDNNVKVKATIFRAKPWGRDDIYLDPSKNNKEPFFWSQLPRPEHSEYRWVQYVDELDRLTINEELKKVIAKELQKREQ